VCVQGGSLTHLGGQFIGNSAWATNRPWGGTGWINGKTCRGGALYNQSAVLTLVGCTFLSNKVTGGDASYKFAFPGNGQGGAVFNDRNAARLRLRVPIEHGSRRG